jgi:hypothetical protein
MRGKENALVLHAALGKTIVAMALTAVLTFSGFLLRSFGNGKGEEGKSGNERHPEQRKKRLTH